MHPFSCTNTHHDAKDLVNHDMVKNIQKVEHLGYETQLFYETKKFLTCASGCTFWELIVFLVEVNFKLHKNVHRRSAYFQNLDDFWQSYESLIPENWKKKPSENLFLVPF